jgi:hypothetical protein
MAARSCRAQTAVTAHRLQHQEQIMVNSHPPVSPIGVSVSTAVTAGGTHAQHAEGIVVSTALTAGAGGYIERQHAEGVVASTAIIAGGQKANHAEGIVVSTAITAGKSDCTSGNCSDPTNHAEGIVVTTAIAGGGSHSQHAEGIIARA